MKTIIVLVAILGLVVAGVYFFGGYRSFDPTKQGQAARAAITPGMSWNKVVNTAGDPQEYRIMIRERGRGKNDPGLVRPGPIGRFTPAGLQQHLANKDLPEGFLFIYRFSNTCAFQVAFDNTGTVTSVADAMTIGDLLNPK
jgi:hypothetical protein